jgi:NAD(P)-dependent dehydrogenase (short-subunit alcohol dehydrogenase family)
VAITGGARGIGEAAARLLAARGDRVVIADPGTDIGGANPSARLAEQVAAGICDAGGAAIACPQDVSSADGANAAVRAAVETWGALHAVVNNAGSLRVLPMLDMSDEDWESVISSHLGHTFQMTRSAGRQWQQQRREGDMRPYAVVNVVAATGLVGRPDMGANHAAAKGAMAALTLVLGQELDELGVSVNAVCPAAVRTRMADHVGARLPDASTPDDPASPLHVARLIAYLASPDARWVTGQIFRSVGRTIGLYKPWHVSASIDGPPLDAKDDEASQNLHLRFRQLVGTAPGGRVTVAR